MQFCSLDPQVKFSSASINKLSDTIGDIVNFRPYLGNSQIKRDGVKIEWTPEMLAEFIKCADDPLYFSEKYIQIVHVDHGLIPIELYPYQKNIITTFYNSRRTAVLTARQAGKTTSAVCLILHYVLFNSHKTVALLANKADAAREILDRIKIAYENLPKWIQQGVVQWNKGSVEFENGCKILASATTSSSIRGKSVSFLYIDETAWVENWDTFFASVYPTISAGITTKILLTSTPNGLNHFYQTCQLAERGDNGYKLIKVMWYDVPGRDEAWKKETLGAMNNDQDKFEQEYCCEFIGSSGTLISGSVLKSMKFKEPIFVNDMGLKIYQKPDENRVYTLIADVSRGRGLDYSAFHVIDISQMPYNQVATFRNNTITPSDYASVIKNVGLQFNYALVFVELNDMGEAVANILHDDFEYENLIFTQLDKKAMKPVLFGKSTDNKGIKTTKLTKRNGCLSLKLITGQYQLIINDFETISELGSFVIKGNSWEAEDGKHDDLAMGLVLFSWLASCKHFSDFNNINTIKSMKESSEELLHDLNTPFGIFDDGRGEAENLDIPLMSSNGFDRLLTTWND